MPLLAWWLGLPQGRECGQSPGGKSVPQLKTDKEMRPTQSFKCKELNSAKENKLGFWIVSSFLSASRKKLSLISAWWNHEQWNQQYYIGLLTYKTEFINGWCQIKICDKLLHSEKVTISWIFLCYIHYSLVSFSSCN